MFLIKNNQWFNSETILFELKRLVLRGPFVGVDELKNMAISIRKKSVYYIKYPNNFDENK